MPTWFWTGLSGVSSLVFGAFAGTLPAATVRLLSGIAAALCFVAFVVGMRVELRKRRLKRRPSGPTAATPPPNGDALLKAAGLYKTPAERRQQEQQLTKDMETSLREMGTYGLSLGLQVAQQMTRRDPKATGDLDDGGDAKVS